MEACPVCREKPLLTLIESITATQKANEAILKAIEENDRIDRVKFTHNFFNVICSRAYDIQEEIKDEIPTD